MFKKIIKYYRDQSFFPGFFGVFTNPFYFARKNLVSGVEKFSHLLGGDLVDIGCGMKPYRRLFNVKSYRGLDIDSELTRKRAVADDLYQGKRFPYSECAFDSVLCNQVLEHVFNPDEFLSEVRRILKDDGKLLLTVPFVWDEHEQPFDYARYSTFGLIYLLEKNGFNIILHQRLGTDVTVIFQMINMYLYKKSESWPRLFRLTYYATVIAMVNLVGIVARRILPENQDLYLDHIILAEKHL